MGYIYLLHFDRPLSHAKHYLGFSEKNPLKERIPLHADGKSRVRIMEALKAAGIGFKVAKIWKRKSRTEERRMKKRGKSHICPICIAEKETEEFNKQFESDHINYYDQKSSEGIKELIDAMHKASPWIGKTPTEGQVYRMHDIKGDTGKDFIFKNGKMLPIETEKV